MSRFTVADRVGVIEADDDVFVARLPDGPILRLSGTAAAIWRAALENGDVLLSYVSAVVGMPDTEIAEDVDAFISDLVERGLLMNHDVGRY